MVSPPSPFVFWKAAFLVEVLPLRAASLSQLLTGVTLAPELSIFHHLHQRFFYEPARLPEYPNDFAAWADRELGDAVVAERLANLNLFRSIDLAVVRRELSVILAQHLQEHGDARRVAAGSAFRFCQPRLVVFPSGQQARTPAEFLEVLRRVDSDTIGYHLFAPKITPGPVANDFAVWFAQWGYHDLARQLDAFDPYLNSLEDNRAYLLELIELGLHQPRPGEIHD
ncbi:MAG: hypothetical protein KatS3mg131_3654 [Candidatus Tectimicrobiota bacterium]|nr:MAG: hypothetical protein KatS3mg131_3654 [Candidatus Tectomicrobia bacterium]